MKTEIQKEKLDFKTHPYIVTCAIICGVMLPVLGIIFISNITG